MPTDAETEREREVEEERAYDREFKAADVLPQVGDVFIGYPAKIVRDWVRSVLLPPALKRLYDTGMGVQTFSTPTMAGNVVDVEASAAVQVKALSVLVAIGVPGQLGIVDGDGHTLPGVIALGPLDLDAARASVHGERYVSPEAHARAQAGLLTSGPLPPMSDRIAAGEFTIVEQEEGIGTQVREDVDASPGPIEPHESREQAILKRRLAARQKTNGRPNGTNGRH